MPKAVVLLSGGLDSAVTLAHALKEGFAAHALTLAYGQRHAVEMEAARRVAFALGAASHKVVAVPLDAFGGSALTDDIPVPMDREIKVEGRRTKVEGSERRTIGDKLTSEATSPNPSRLTHRASPSPSEIPVTYVPARNTVFLSLALAYAETLGAHDLFLGVNAVDYSGYPDCRPEFLEAFERLANLATKMGIEGESFHVHAPLIELTKAEIIERGLELGVDFALTHSCYAPDQAGRACGRCDSCQIRGRAFAELGLVDPALA